MNRFLYPEMFLLLFLPWCIFFLLPKVSGPLGGALKVPFLDDIKQIKARIGSLHFPFIEKTLSFSFKLLYVYTIWTLLVFAAARPQYVGEPHHIRKQSRDIMLVVDISNSMLQPDFSTQTRRLDRMTAVKAVISAFIEKRTEDRFGLILFGTQAYLQSPLTFDRQTVKEILLNTDAGMAGGSTSIGDALGLALKNLKDNNKNNKLIILLTDGENNDGFLSMAQAISLAEKENIKIYTVGVGGQANFIESLFHLRDAELDETSLKELAKRTQGNYFRASDLNDLSQIYQQIDTLEPQVEKQNIVQETKELFYIPLLLALFLLSLLIFKPGRSLHD